MQRLLTKRWRHYGAPIRATVLVSAAFVLAVAMLACCYPNQAVLHICADEPDAGASDGGDAGDGVGGSEDPRCEMIRKGGG